MDFYYIFQHLMGNPNTNPHDVKSNIETCKEYASAFEQERRDYVAAQEAEMNKKQAEHDKKELQRVRDELQSSREANAKLRREIDGLKAAKTEPSKRAK